MKASFTEVKIFMNTKEPQKKWLLATKPDALYMLETLLAWEDKGTLVPLKHTDLLREIIATEVSHVVY